MRVADPILNCCIPWGYSLNYSPQNTKSLKKNVKKTCPTDFQDVRIDFVPTVHLVWWTVPGPSFLEKSALALRSTESREHRGAGVEHLVRLVRKWRFHQPPPQKKAAKIIQNQAIFQEKLGLLCLTMSYWRLDLKRWSLRATKGHETSKHIKKEKLLNKPSLVAHLHCTGTNQM